MEAVMMAATDRTMPPGLQGLPLGLNTANCVFFGPEIGEFAYEVAGAGVCRREAKRYRHVIVCSRPDRAYLHADYCTEFIPHDIDCNGMCAIAAPMPPSSELAKWIPMGVRVVRPVDYGTRSWPGDYIRYGQYDPQWQGAIVIHARNRPHVPQRNWPPEHWNKLARWLGRVAPGRRLVCIGTPNHALAVERCADLRNRPLGEQANVLRTAGESAGFILGPSSGPLHFAEFCGCPTMVWCGGDGNEMNNTTQFYRTAWNPFGVRADVHQYSDWQPPLDTVKGWVTDFLKGMA